MDARRTARWAGALALIIGPLSITLGSFVPTYGEDDPVSTQLGFAAGHLDALSISNLLLLPQMAMVPAVFFLALLARRGAPRLSVVGGGISVLAWLAAMVGFGAYGIALEAAAAVPDTAGASAVLDGIGANTVYTILVLGFVAGHVIGMLVLGIGLWRSRVAPAWVGLFVAFLPLVHVGARLIGPVADGVVYALLTVAMGYLAVVLVRMRDEDWDLAPARVTLQEPVASQV